MVSFCSVCVCVLEVSALQYTSLLILHLPRGSRIYFYDNKDLLQSCSHPPYHQHIDISANGDLATVGYGRGLKVSGRNGTN